MYNNFDLVDHCKEWLKYPTRYGWGCWGQPVSDSIITSKARQYPGHYDRSRQAQLRKLIGKAWLIDCVGLIKNYYWGMTPGGSKVNYIAKTDVSADDMYYRARIKGPISNMPDLPGICVQLPGHIGVYIGGGKVIESTRGAFGDGVVVTKLTARKWVHWLQCPYITYFTKEEVLDVALDKWMVEGGRSALAYLEKKGLVLNAADWGKEEKLGAATPQYLFWMLMERLTKRMEGDE